MNQTIRMLHVANVALGNPYTGIPLELCHECYHHFPKIFDDAAQASFMESSETYQTLFADAAKYKAIMNALAQILYRDLK